MGEKRNYEEKEKEEEEEFLQFLAGQGRKEGGRLG